MAEQMFHDLRDFWIGFGRVHSPILYRVAGGTESPSVVSAKMEEIYPAATRLRKKPNLTVKYTKDANDDLNGVTSDSGDSPGVLQINFTKANY